MKQRFLTFIALSLLSGAAAAASVPNTFSPNTPAVASQVNDNFTALVNAVTSLESRVNKLEGQLTVGDVAGTFTLLSFQAMMNANGTAGGIRHQTQTLSVTLNGDGTGSLASSQAHNADFKVDQNLNSVTVVTGSSAEGGGGFTWSLSGNTVVTNCCGSYVHAAGGRLFIDVGKQFSAPTTQDQISHIHLLIRN